MQMTVSDNSDFSCAILSYLDTQRMWNNGHVAMFKGFGPSILPTVGIRVGLRFEVYGLGAVERKQDSVTKGPGCNTVTTRTSHGFPCAAYGINPS